MYATKRNHFVVIATLAVLTGCATEAEPPPLRSIPAAPAAITRPVTITPQVKSEEPARARATGTLEDARRHVVRGAAAIEMAKNMDDLAQAADEFRQATEIAPAMAEAWYNLGAVLAKTGKLDEAIASYRRYLALSPSAADAQKVSDEIIKLEYRQEQMAKEQASSGIWVESDGTPYRMQINGNKWQLSTTIRPFQPDVDNYYGPGLGSIGMPTSAVEQISFNLELRGGKLTGTWQRAETQVDLCTVPAETGDVQAELDAAKGTLSLQFSKSRYKALTAEPFIFSFDTKATCREVSVLERRSVRFVLQGPIPSAGIGAVVTSAHGLFSSTDWIGELRVVNTADGSPAAQAGLYRGDLLLAINGVEVKSLTAGEAIRHLRGEPGTEVRLIVQRPSSNAPVTVTLRRQALPDLPEKMDRPWYN